MSASTLPVSPSTSFPQIPQHHAPRPWLQQRRGAKHTQLTEGAENVCQHSSSFPLHKFSTATQRGRSRRKWR